MSIVERIFRKMGYVPWNISRTITCAWCGKPFTWEGHTEDNHPSFCSTNHRKRSSEARGKRIKRREAENSPRPKSRPLPEPVDMNKVGRCPNPYKINFRTRKEAEAVIQRVDPTMGVYKCVCGGMHIGHSSRSRS